MANDAYVNLIGFVATQPKKGRTKTGSLTLSMRVGWTPRAVNKATGEWSDLPSSFATVQCYRKVAEHAAVCLRKGDPIVLRGSLRVREYTDQSGQRRSAVEIQAESLGHDMGRGISTYSKLQARTELTADEYEESLAAGERSRLPGDVEQSAEDAREPGGGTGEEWQRGELNPDDSEDTELAGEDEYDEPGEGDAASSAVDMPEPVGAPA